jgi:hypothetical protein
LLPAIPPEIDGFIGIPLLVLAIGLAWNSRRSARMQLTVVVLLGAALLSLGPHLAVNHHLTQLPLPFWIVTHVPLLDNILASRISLEVAAGVAAVIAFGLDDVSRRSNRVHQHSPSGRSRAATALVGVVLAALVVSWLPRWPNGDQPAEALPVVIRQATPRGDPVALTYPYASPAFAQPLLWQAADGFGFRLVGGYAEHPDPHDRPTGFPNPLRPAGLDLFLEGQEGYDPYLPRIPITPALVAITRATFSRYDVRVVIVDRAVKGSGTVERLLTEVLGTPRATSGSFILWASHHGPL